jgi:hypothetical protein
MTLTTGVTLEPSSSSLDTSPFRLLSATSGAIEKLRDAVNDRPLTEIAATDNNLPPPDSLWDRRNAFPHAGWNWTHFWGGATRGFGLRAVWTNRDRETQATTEEQSVEAPRNPEAGGKLIFVNGDLAGDVWILRLPQK